MNIRINKVAAVIIGVVVLLALSAGVTLLVTNHTNAHNAAVVRTHNLLAHAQAHRRAVAAQQRREIDQANQRANQAEHQARQARHAARQAANRPVVVAPQPVVVQPAAPAVPSGGLTDCGTGTQDEAVFANAATSCPFALNVESDYWNAPGMTFTSYSPVTNQDYAMSATDDGTTVTVTGGTDSLVEFGHGDLGR